MNPDSSAWASRRKTAILIALVLILTGISFAIFWKFWFAEPSCFDGNQNGDETGVDCGGSCNLVCGSGAMKPIVRWDPRLFEVSPGLWSVLVYVENPNIGIDAVYVPYTFTFYDSGNKVIEKREGATILPRNRTVGIFEGSIIVKDGIRPKRTVFELGNNIVWNKSQNGEDDIKITHGALQRENYAPRVPASVKNTGTEELKNIELIVAIFDGSDNAIAASRTFVESLKKDQGQDIFFTWPRPFDLGYKACEKNSDVILLLDRSGSMASAGKNPVQPLTDAKAAAVSFVEKLNLKNKVGVASFATNAKKPIELNLTSDFEAAKSAINSIAIEQGSTQFTNVYEALHSAWEELVSARSEGSSSKVIVLLTDGVANNPKDPEGRSEADDIKYAESLALKEADSVKKEGHAIYTIGLGNAVNQEFLKAAASSGDNYFFAPAAADLEKIYQNISSDICKEVPARIEITYRIFGSSI